MKVFIRDDDLGYNDLLLFDFMKVFVDKGMKLNLEAIPARCYQNKTMLDRIRPLLESGLFEIHQHGISHLPIEPYTEFGNRNVHEVEKELDAGKNILIECFGDYFKPFFTAPWEKIEGKLIDSIRSKYLGISPNDLPIYFDFRIRDDKGPRWKTIDELKKDMNYVLSLPSTENIICGIRIHHYLIKKKETLDLISEFLDYLKLNNIELVFFSEIQLSERFK